jgi:hypothetical protein
VSAWVTAPEPTKVTKLTTETSTVQVPPQATDAHIQAWGQAEVTSSSPSPTPTWSEPSWVLFNAATAPPTATSTLHRSPWYATPQEKTENLIIFVSVVVGGAVLAIFLAIIICYIRANKQQWAANCRRKASASRCERNADIERTAGLSTAATAEGSHARAADAGRVVAESVYPRESVGDVISMPEYPAPVYLNNIPPQETHYPEGEMVQPAPRT